MLSKIDTIASSLTAGATAPMANAARMLGQSAEVAESGGFSSVLSNAIDSVNQLQQTSKGLQQAYQLGDPTVGLEDTMVAMNQASMSFQMLAQTRNKVVQAYSEIMNMSL